MAHVLEAHSRSVATLSQNLNNYEQDAKELMELEKARLKSKNACSCQHVSSQ
ncbi:hypothetical protein [Helicobacter labacensis]|uniref:hypothetical protein n=1 Tax=Helicobacter labacensis TaxID=2316079 RepID=UPI0013CE1D45|nr:hypothetical protein [Helicobacter labacensis]